MTNARRTLDDLLALWHRCDYCLAEPGVWCVVGRGRTAGKTTTWLHQDRLFPTQTAHFAGHTWGRANALRDILREIDNAGQRWSELTRPLGGEPALADVVALIRKRRAIAEEWHQQATTRGLEAIPSDWRRG